MDSETGLAGRERVEVRTDVASIASDGACEDGWERAPGPRGARRAGRHGGCRPHLYPPGSAHQPERSIRARVSVHRARAISPNVDTGRPGSRRSRRVKHEQVREDGARHHSGELERRHPGDTGNDEADRVRELAVPTKDRNQKPRPILPNCCTISYLRPKSLLIPANANSDASRICALQRAIVPARPRARGGGRLFRPRRRGLARSGSSSWSTSVSPFELEGGPGSRPARNSRLYRHDEEDSADRHDKRALFCSSAPAHATLSPGVGRGLGRIPWTVRSGCCPRLSPITARSPSSGPRPPEPRPVSPDRRPRPSRKTRAWRRRSSCSRRRRRRP